MSFIHRRLFENGGCRQMRIRNSDFKKKTTLQQPAKYILFHKSCDNAFFIMNLTY